jgi:23S rRNA (pseudouridine1915-N3)-methyltransferase
MRLLVVVVGRVRGTLAPAVEEFEERAGHYWKLEVHEVNAGIRGRGQADPRQVREAEAQRIRDWLPQGIETWALTRTGRALSSTGLAKLLQDRQLRGGRDLAFVIGGAFGLDAHLLGEARRRISLASVTLPHEMARLVLAEQLYRAGSILRGEPYHKGAS